MPRLRLSTGCSLSERGTEAVLIHLMSKGSLKICSCQSWLDRVGSQGFNNPSPNPQTLHSTPAYQCECRAFQACSLDSTFLEEPCRSTRAQNNRSPENCRHESASIDTAAASFHRLLAPASAQIESCDMRLAAACKRRACHQRAQPGQKT